MPTVTYKGASSSQVDFAGDDPRTTLTIGETYELEAIETHDFYTLFKLAMVEGHFNSVFFENVNLQPRASECKMTSKSEISLPMREKLMLILKWGGGAGIAYVVTSILMVGAIYLDHQFPNSFNLGMAIILIAGCGGVVILGLLFGSGAKEK